MSPFLLVYLINIQIYIDYALKVFYIIESHTDFRLYKMIVNSISWIFMNIVLENHI